MFEVGVVLPVEVCWAGTESESAAGFWSVAFPCPSLGPSAFDSSDITTPGPERDQQPMQLDEKIDL